MTGVSLTRWRPHVLAADSAYDTLEIPCRNQFVTAGHLTQ